MTLVWILVGAFIGWSLPQPAWAKSLQDAVMAKLSGLNKK